MKGDDETFEATAIRETREEVGVELTHEDFLGYLGKFQPRVGSIWVVAAVFSMGAIETVTPNQEVASYKWVLFGDIMSPENRTRHVLTRDGVPIAFPAIRLGDYLVWGLTQKILDAIIEPAEEGTLV